MTGAWREGSIADVFNFHDCLRETNTDETVKIIFLPLCARIAIFLCLPRTRTSPEKSLNKILLEQKFSFACFLRRGFVGIFQYDSR